MLKQGLKQGLSTRVETLTNIHFFHRKMVIQINFGVSKTQKFNKKSVKQFCPKKVEKLFEIRKCSDQKLNIKGT